MSRRQSMDAAGGHLCLTVAAGQAAAVASTRPVQAARVLEGRKAEEALELVPLLFAGCASAQSAAARLALAAAAGEPVDGQTLVALQERVRAETMREHVRLLFLELPPLLDAPPQTAPARALLAGAGSAAGEQLDWRGAEDIESWSARGRTWPAQLFGRLIGEGLADFGRNAVPPLGGLEPEAMAALLAADETGAFAAAPQWRGQPLETGAFARLHDHPAIAGLRRRWGNGLTPRLAAVALELALIADRRKKPRLLSHAGASGTGLGIVECARGRLVHWISLNGGRIASWRIVAPTEWNFHPSGTVVEGLCAARPAADFARAARLWLAAFNPCVPVTLQMAEAAHA